MQMYMSLILAPRQIQVIKSRQVIRRAIRRNPDAVVCVTGCYAQTSSAEIMEIPGVDVVVGNKTDINYLVILINLEKNVNQLMVLEIL